MIGIDVDWSIAWQLKRSTALRDRRILIEFLIFANDMMLSKFDFSL